MGYHLDFSVVGKNYVALVAGLGNTWLYTLAALFFGFVIAIIVVPGKSSEIKVLRYLTTAYIEAFRNTPAVVQLFFIYFGLARFGLDLSPGVSAVLALALNHGAYISEIIRGGIAAVPREQWESAYSIGLRKPQVYRYVVFPNAIRIAYPSLCNQFIIGLVWVSLVSVVSARDMVYQASILDSLTFRTFEIYLTVGAVYLANVIAFSYALKLIGRLAFPFESPKLSEIVRLRVAE